MNKAIRKWLDTATPEEKKQLAKLAKTSVDTILQLASQHRFASSDFAGRIEDANDKLRKKNRKLPVLRRKDIAPACAACKYAKRRG